MMLVENSNLKVIQAFVNAKIEVLIDRKTTHASGDQHPKRNQHGQTFPIEQARHADRVRGLPAQNKKKNEKKEGAGVECERLEVDEGVLIKIGVLRDGRIACDFENSRALGDQGAEEAEQGAKPAERNERGMTAGIFPRVISTLPGCPSSRKVLESSKDFRNFDALETGLQGIVTRLVRWRQNRLGVPDQPDMIAFRQPQLQGRPAQRDQGQLIAWAKWSADVLSVMRPSSSRRLATSCRAELAGFATNLALSASGSCRAQFLLETSEALMLSHQHDLAARGLQDHFASSEPPGIGPLELGQRVPAAPREKTDSPDGATLALRRTRNGQGHVHVFQPIGPLEKLRRLRQMAIENIAAARRGSARRHDQVEIDDVGQGAELL